MNNLKFYRVSELSELLSIGKSTIWAWVKVGRFPKPLKMSSRMTVWSANDIEAWIANKD